MKKLALSSLGALVLNLLLVAPALAQNGSNNNVPNVGGDVVAPVVGPQGGTAFTGADITVWMALVAALLVLGVAFLIMGRRRRAIAE